MAGSKISEDIMPPLSASENLRRDAEAERDFEEGIAIPSGEVFDWLHDRIDGGSKPAPKPRKI